MPTPLTDRQQAVLAALEALHEQAGMPPTLQEMADALGLASVRGVVKHLQTLEEKGYVALTPNRSRGIRLLHGQARGRHLRVPLVGRVAAGQPILSDGHVEREMLVDRSLFCLRPRYLLRVHGDSMQDTGILHGDLIGVHPTPVAEHGQIVVARVGDEGITVKKLHRKGRSIRLMPSNLAFSPIDPDPTEDFAIEGLYCGLLRSV